MVCWSLRGPLLSTRERRRHAQIPRHGRETVLSELKTGRPNCFGSPPPHLPLGRAEEESDQPVEGALVAPTHRCPGTSSAKCLTHGRAAAIAWRLSRNHLSRPVRQSPWGAAGRASRARTPPCEPLCHADLAGPGRRRGSECRICPTVPGEPHPRDFARQPRVEPAVVGRPLSRAGPAEVPPPDRSHGRRGGQYRRRPNGHFRRLSGSCWLSAVKRDCPRPASPGWWSQRWSPAVSRPPPATLSAV